MSIAATVAAGENTPVYANTSAPKSPPAKLPTRTILHYRSVAGTLASRSIASATGGSVFSV